MFQARTGLRTVVALRGALLLALTIIAAFWAPSAAAQGAAQRAVDAAKKQCAGKNEEISSHDSIKRDLLLGVICRNAVSLFGEPRAHWIGIQSTQGGDDDAGVELCAFERGVGMRIGEEFFDRFVRHRVVDTGDGLIQIEEGDMLLLSDFVRPRAVLVAADLARALVPGLAGNG